MTKTIVRDYCNLNANHASMLCAFRYVLSYLHNENELTELKRLISGRNSIFVYLKLQYTFDLKDGRLHTVDMVKITYKVIITSHAKPSIPVVAVPTLLSTQNGRLLLRLHSSRLVNKLYMIINW